MQNGPNLLNARAVAMHMNARVAGPHSVHSIGPRMQPPGIMQMNSPVNQGMPGNTPYTYTNPSGGPQNVQVGE